ncbi:NUMOD3 motif protein [Paenarthrobacter nitroguajacolicus]|uniref:NUMOD3 motif protein n=1 Tax=Paenarthrobacter nitroguajacolicus TaxID=211146 RepID=A0A558GXU5_PAENT|nr:NUMOD3 domain-containing DNA-binding protein [Paenarthrobacter nitroguajacolicus]TVU61679.1 NUMOD3 motif protein [Paenarthrobacter nitroguajacolicus]
MEDSTVEIGSVYGVRLRREREYRYVGITTKPISRRFSQHLKVARSGRKTPFYDWLRKQTPDSLLVEQLDVSWDLEELGQAERDWIRHLRLGGDRLLNLSEGGLGPTGVQWTEEQREAARLRSTGRRGLVRPGEENPFYGGRHTLEQRTKWSQERKGSMLAEANPNFGKFGPNHPSFGRSMTEEARKALSEARTGIGNPNFGKKASAETRAKMSAVRKGKPMPSSRRNAHTRHHTNKGVVNPTCQHCIDDAAQVKLMRESETTND